MKGAAPAQRSAKQAPNANPAVRDDRPRYDPAMGLIERLQRDPRPPPLAALAYGISIGLTLAILLKAAFRNRGEVI